MRSRFTVALVVVAALVLGLGSFAQTSNGAVFVGSFRWQLDGEDFGGFSGLHVGATGGDFTTINDRAFIGTGSITRNDQGVISAISDARFNQLSQSDNAPEDGSTNDAEGLAIGDEGQLIVSFEGLHRIMQYAVRDAKAIWHKHYDVFDGLQHNSGLEALARDGDGILYTVPERSGKLTRPFPMYRFQNNEWDQPFGIPRRPPYLVVGADFGPDGKFYLLERHLAGLFGFKSRVRRFQITGDSIGAEEVLLETPAGKHDNLEGISVWRDGAGDIRITMISDDNFKAFQKTEFVEYRIAE
jgi:hypothetical protein